MLSDAPERSRLLSDFSRSYLVEAGAGSGKTAIMAGRLALLFASGVSPERVVALSFTDFAAQELANRVRRFLTAIAAGNVPLELELGVPNGVSDSQRKHAQKAIGLLDRFTCSTLHSFARSLIMRYPAEANIDPGATLMTEQEQSLLFTEIQDAWVRRNLATGDPAESFLAGAVTHAGTNALNALFSLAQTLLAGDEHTVQTPETERYRTAAKDFQFAIERAITELHGATLAPEERRRDALHNLRVIADIVGAGENPFEAGFFVVWANQHAGRLNTALINSGAMRKRLFTKKAWIEVWSGDAKARAEYEFAAFQEAWDEVLAAHRELTSVAADTVVAEFYKLAEELVGAYQQAKRNRALLDFDDLIPAALNLVRTHRDIAAQLQDTYDYFFIDEFQDTDPRSAELFWRLSGTPTQNGWETWPARGASRFVVGDPKQAIYRFRGADVTTYQMLKEHFRRDPNAQEVWISSNFRSDAAIIDATNEIFQAPLDADDQPGYAPLSAVQPRGNTPALWRLPVTIESEKPAMSEIIEAEANAVADLCARYIAGDSALTERPLRPADIALLLLTSTHVAAYERALINRGIPVSTAAGKHVLKQQEVHDFLIISRVLASEEDTLALVALLRGPLVGASEEQLLATWTEVTEQTGEWAVTRSTNPALISDPVIRTALERVQELLAFTATTTPEQVLRRAAALFEVPVILRNRVGDLSYDRAAANVEWVFRYASDFATRSMSAFARAFTTRWERGEDESEPGNDAASGTVQIVTMHRAKGLEWPVVIPVSTLTSSRTPTGVLRDRETNLLAMKIGPAETSNFADAKEREDDAVHADRTRLWYVTFTRARNHFVLPVADKLTSASPLQHIIDWEPLAAPFVPHPVEAPVVPSVERGDAAQSAASFGAEHERIQAETQRFEWHHPSTDEISSAEADSFVTTVQSPAAYTSLGAGVPRFGTAGGIVLHELFNELIAGLVASDRAALRERAAALLAHLPETTSVDPDALAHVVLNGWNLPQVQSWHGRLVAEVPVFSAAGQRLTSGVIDAVVLSERGELTGVVDWKSDADPAPSVREQYRNQVRSYLNLTNIAIGYIVYVALGTVETVHV